MATSSNGERRPLETPRTYCVELFSTLQGGGASTNLTNLDATRNGGGEITAATWLSTGRYTITFAKKWPLLLYAPEFTFVDVSGTGGANAQATAIDVTAGTATFNFYINNTLTDVASTTTIYVRWVVRAVNKN